MSTRKRAKTTQATWTADMLRTERLHLLHGHLDEAREAGIRAAIHAKHAMAILEELAKEAK